jgi:hypothetical protein
MHQTSLLARNGRCGAASACPLSERSGKHVLGESISSFDPSETLSLIVRDDEPAIANSWQKNERDDD